MTGRQTAGLLVCLQNEWTDDKVFLLVQLYQKILRLHDMTWQEYHDWNLKQNYWATQADTGLKTASFANSLLHIYGLIHHFSLPFFVYSIFFSKVNVNAAVITSSASESDSKFSFLLFTREVCLDDYAPQRVGHASLPGTTASLGDRAFAAAGHWLWNSLPPHLRDADLPYSRFRIMDDG